MALLTALGYALGGYSQGRHKSSPTSNRRSNSTPIRRTASSSLRSKSRRLPKRRRRSRKVSRIAKQTWALTRRRASLLFCQWN